MSQVQSIGFLNNVIKTKNIGEYIQHAVFTENINLILIALFVLLAIFIIILFKYTYKKQNTDIIAKLQYHKQLKLANLQPCSKLPTNLQYRLCDYYIASSFNTANIGKQQLDYVSKDMIAKALTSGARFIQLTICSDFSTTPVPVVCQSLTNKSHITSLNTIPIRDALNTIRDFAFKYVDNTANSGAELLNYDTINYPLIIQLKLHTNDTIVLNKLHTDIINILGRFLLENKQYYKKPIHLEKLCKLLNKIIIIATPGYESSKLTEIIIPASSNLFKTIKYTDLKLPVLNDKTIDNYYKQLSVAKQKYDYKMVDKMAKQLNNVLDNVEQVFETNINDDTGQLMTDKLTMFNMIGFTIVEPDDDTTDSINVNPILPFTYGCQCVPMNYQNSDDYMSLYIQIFAKGSYVLKPSGLRLPIGDGDSIDTIDSRLNTYDMTKTKLTQLNISPTFIVSNSHKLITLQETYSGQNKYIVPAGSNKLTLVMPKSKTDGLTRAFIVKPSPLGNNLVLLLTADRPGMAITVRDNIVKLDVVSDSMDELKYQSFYPEASNVTSTNETHIKFRIYHLADYIHYLGITNNTLKQLSVTEDEGLMKFKYTRVNAIEQLTVEHVSFGFVKVFSSGAIGLSKGDSGTEFKVSIVPDKQTASPLKRTIRLMVNDKYISTKYNSLIANQTHSDDSGTLFTLSKTLNTDTEFTIQNDAGYYLVGNSDGTLSFKKEYETLNTAKKDADGHVIKPAKMAPNLGTAKYFKLAVKYLMVSP